MRQRTPRTIRRATGLIAAATVLMAACGNDNGAGSDDSGGSTGTFCEEIQALAESSDGTSEAESLAALQSVADAAPDEISGEMDQLVAGLEQLLSFDPEASSEEEMNDFLAMADGLDEASTAVEEFALENCPGLPADLFATE